MCCLCLHDETVGGDELRGHHTERSEALGDDITLHVSVVVLARPHEPSVSLDGLGDHVVCEERRKQVRLADRDGGRDAAGDVPINRCSYQIPALLNSAA